MREVDLHVVIKCLKKNAVLYDRSKQIIIEICRLLTRLNNSYGKSTGHATDVSLAEFCMEMFDGGK